MPAYRIYTLEIDGHVWQPSHIAECENDETVIQTANRLLNGNAIEFWEKARCILGLFPAHR